MLPPKRSPPTACRHTVSGTISLPSQGFFSPFPHGTSSLSVASTCLALRDGPRRFPQGFSCPAVLRNARESPVSFCLRGYHTLWPIFPNRSASRWIGNSLVLHRHAPYNPGRSLSGHRITGSSSHGRALVLQIARWLDHPMAK